MKIGDLVNVKGENRTGIILGMQTTREGIKEYSVRWYPTKLGKSWVSEDKLEPINDSARDESLRKKI
jgi:hypothetical protein